MKGGPSARVLIADDHALLKAGMRATLAGEPGIEVISEAADGREAVELCRELRPDLVMMDVGVPRMDGIEATRAIKKEYPAVSVLMVTAHPSPDYMLGSSPLTWCIWGDPSLRLGQAAMACRVCSAVTSSVVVPRAWARARSSPR